MNLVAFVFVESEVSESNHSLSNLNLAIENSGINYHG